MDGPVQRAEKGARGDLGVRAGEQAASHARGDQRPDGSLVAVALRHDWRAQAGRQRVDFEVRRGTLDLVEDAQDVGDGEIAQALREGPAPGARGGGGREQPIQRPILAEEEDLVLARKVVVQVARREVGGHGNLAHAGGGEAARPEHLRGGAENLDPAAVGPRAGAAGREIRTDVRKSNHGSIVRQPGSGVKPHPPPPPAPAGESAAGDGRDPL